MAKRKGMNITEELPFRRSMVTTTSTKENCRLTNFDLAIMVYLVTFILSITSLRNKIATWDN